MIYNYELSPECYFKNGDITKKNMKDVVSSFNHFFGNVGPDLAAKINKRLATECGKVDEMRYTNAKTFLEVLLMVKNL